MSEPEQLAKDTASLWDLPDTDAEKEKEIEAKAEVKVESKTED